MRKYLIAWTVAIACSSMAFAGGGGGGRGFGGRVDVNPSVSITQNVTDLTDDQKTNLTAASDALTAALTAWTTSSDEALTPLRQQAVTPDAAVQKNLADETYKQNLLREDILVDAELKMVAILNPAQAEKWEAARLVQQVTARYGTLGLTAEQTAKLTALQADAAKKLAGIKDKTALAKAKADFWTSTLAVLNEIQVGQIFVPTFAAGGSGFGGRGFGGRGRRGGGGGAGGGG